MKKSRMIRSKKVIIALLAAAMTFSIASISAFAAIDTGTKETPIITDIENILRNLQKEAMASKANRAAASYQASITVYPQITGYYCGPASAYSILRSWGVNVPSSTKTLAFFNGCPSSCPYPNVNHICVQSYTSPQVTLADSMGVGYAGADFIMLKNEINSRLPTRLK